MPVIDWRFVATSGQLLRVAAVESVDAVRPDLALKRLSLRITVWVAWSWAWAGRKRCLRAWLPSDLLLLWRWAALEAARDEMERCWTVGRLDGRAA
jgi:hypothetical protein